MTSTQIPTSTRVFVLQNHVENDIRLTEPSGPSKDDTFALQVHSVPSPDTLSENEILVQTLALSNDPAQRRWVDKPDGTERADMKPLEPGTPMHCFALSKVIAVGSAGSDENFKVGDLVTSRSTWAEYTVLQKGRVTPVTYVRKILQPCLTMLTCCTSNIPGLSPTVWLGALGLSGLTAYFGLRDICKLKESDTLVVSGAAGYDLFL